MSYSQPPLSLTRFTRSSPRLFKGIRHPPSALTRHMIRIPQTAHRRICRWGNLLLGMSKAAMNLITPSPLSRPSPVVSTRISSTRGLVLLICGKPSSKRTGPVSLKPQVPHSPTRQNKDSSTRRGYGPGLTRSAPEGTPVWTTSRPLSRGRPRVSEVGSQFASVPIPPPSARQRAKPLGSVLSMNCREPYAAERKSHTDEAMPLAEV
jgi:hypothetical protein